MFFLTFSGIQNMIFNDISKNIKLIIFTKAIKIQPLRYYFFHKKISV